MFKLEEVADEKGQVEFNVYSFSGRTSDYVGIIKVLRSGRIYTSSVLELSWEDVYHLSASTYFTETTIAFLISGLMMIVPSTLLIFYRHTRKRREPS